MCTTCVSFSALDLRKMFSIDDRKSGHVPRIYVQFHAACLVFQITYEHNSPVSDHISFTTLTAREL